MDWHGDPNQYAGNCPSSGPWPPNEPYHHHHHHMPPHPHPHPHPLPHPHPPHHHNQHHPNNAFSNPFPPPPLRKRPWQRENVENPALAKLYVAQVSKTATEEVIGSLFEQFGQIVEVVMLKDKHTSHPTGNCFVKYASFDAAHRAIGALNNQHVFPGEVIPITVKFADREKERHVRQLPLAGVGDRLYVCGLNPEGSNKDVEEVFSPYGRINDIYILKNNPGCGFVNFANRDMALAAINALNGNFVMRGCVQPLIVRFADPKKPRNNIFNSATSGPYSQEPDRLVPNNSHSNGGQNLASYPVQQISQPSMSHLANQEQQASTVIQSTFPPLRPPLHLSRIPLQQTQNTQSSQSSQVAVMDMQKQHLTQSSGQIIGQQQSSQTVSSNFTSAEVPSTHKIATPQECDWSEHTCPDGYKYYYNCETCESRWDKPDEFALFEQQSQMQMRSHQIQSSFIGSLCTTSLSNTAGIESGAIAV